MATCHARSNSLPSRQHPLVPEFEGQLSRLRSSHEASSSSPTSVASKLSGLEEVYESLAPLLSLPLNQQALSKEQNEKRVDEVLDESLRILDACNIAKDALTQTKESARELQSILRRRRSGEMELASEVKKFLASREVAKKAITKATEKRCNFGPLSMNQESVEIVGMLREVESVTCTAIEEVFSFISGTKSSRWAVVSKFINAKRVFCDDFSKGNEFDSTDAALRLLIGRKERKADSKLEENAKIKLQKLEMCIQDIERGVECLYRCLIKTRVSLLNILNH